MNIEPAKLNTITIAKFVPSAMELVKNARSNILWKNLALNAIVLAKPARTSTSTIFKAKKNAMRYALNAKSVRFVEKK
jgi:hypothetical protein